MGDTFPTLTDLDYLTKHITLKLFSLLQLKGAIYINYYWYIYQSKLIENKGVRLIIEISVLHEFHSLLTNTILYNHMIVIGIYHRFFNLME